MLLLGLKTSNNINFVIDECDRNEVHFMLCVGHAPQLVILLHVFLFLKLSRQDRGLSFTNAR